MTRTDFALSRIPVDSSQVKATAPPDDVAVIVVAY
jgi:hypothetical protein